MSDDTEDMFDAATKFVRGISGKVGQDDLLYFYARFKQANHGPCDAPKPSFYQLTEKAKWQAWRDLGDMPKQTARQQYIDRLSEVEPDWEGEEAKDPTSGWVSVSCPRVEDSQLEDRDKTVFDWVKEGRLDKLVENNAEEERDEDGMSVLHWACDRGWEEIVAWIVKEWRGLLDVQDNDGQTALHYACCCGHENIVKMLLAAGADADIADVDGVTPNNPDTEENIKKLFS